MTTGMAMLVMRRQKQQRVFHGSSPWPSKHPALIVSLRFFSQNLPTHRHDPNQKQNASTLKSLHVLTSPLHHSGWIWNSIQNEVKVLFGGISWTKNYLLGEISCDIRTSPYHQFLRFWLLPRLCNCYLHLLVFQPQSMTKPGYQRQVIVLLYIYIYIM